MKISSERMGNLMSISARVSTYIASNRKKEYLRDSDKQEQGKHRGKAKLTETCLASVLQEVFTDKERSLNRVVPFIIKRTFQTINCEPFCLN